jgi:hypothetical protein
MSAWNDADLSALRILASQIDTKRAEQAAHVRFLRENGCPWSVIAEALGVSRQAAQQRYGRA